MEAGVNRFGRADPEGAVRLDERSRLALGQLQATTPQLEQRPCRIREERRSELFVGNQPADERLDDALCHGHSFADQQRQAASPGVGAKRRTRSKRCNGVN